MTFALRSEIRKALGLIVLAVLAIGRNPTPAQAGYIVTLTEEGSNIVATGSGTIDLTGLSPTGGGNTLSARLNPGSGVIITGPTSNVPIQIYNGVTGPTSFGIALFTVAISGSGDLAGIQGSGPSQLFLPFGYVSDSLLSDTSTYNNRTLSNLGVTPGTYEWTWGSGDHADTFTLNAAVNAVPELPR
jgi:hypothetical protein